MSSLFVHRLPKVELHAHLNGSIRRSTLRSLAQERGIDPSGATILQTWPASLSEAFSVFNVIHSCVKTLHDVERLAFELGQDLEADNVVYAEIRTTPRNMLPDADWDQYVEAVLKGFHAYARSASATTATELRLIISIDRAKHSSAQARDVVLLAEKYRADGVVGIDLSGDPTKGQFLEFLPALRYARSVGLKVTLHAGEVRGMDEEMRQMLAFAPDRFGHCCFVDAANMTKLKTSRIPIELCPTSNLLSNSVPTIDQHHFGIHYVADGQGAVCCVSTDDSGVFGSPLSNEYDLIMHAFGLTYQQVYSLAQRTIQAAFLDTSQEKDRATLERVQRRFAVFEQSEATINIA